MGGKKSEVEIIQQYVVKCETRLGSGVIQAGKIISSADPLFERLEALGVLEAK